MYLHPSDQKGDRSSKVFGMGGGVVFLFEKSSRKHCAESFVHCSVIVIVLFLN